MWRRGWAEVWENLHRKMFQMKKLRHEDWGLEGVHEDWGLGGGQAQFEGD